jgi:hypothetical protein
LIAIAVFVLIILPLSHEGYKFYAEITGADKPKPPVEHHDAPAQDAKAPAGHH